MKTALLALLTISLGWMAPARADRTPPRWSLIIYSAIDEEEIAQYTDPLVARLLRVRLPSDVELLIQNDTFGSQGVTRSIRRPGEATQTQELKEHDSASRKQVASFVRWASKHAQGAHRIFIVMTHSWGWKGIIQDFTLPGKPEEDSMLPLREFASAVAESGMNPDVLFLDSCVLGNVEAISEFADLAPLLVVSQRETPYSGFPYDRLFEMLGNSAYGPTEVARAIPETYVSAYTRGGALAAGEGEFDVVTAATIDTSRWHAFERQFKKLVSKLRRVEAREFLRHNPMWPSSIADIDSDTDLVELLSRLPEWSADTGVLDQANTMLQEIGYPLSEADPAAELIEIPGSKDIRVRIQADSIVPLEKALETIQTRWNEANQDLPPLKEPTFAIQNQGSERVFSVRYSHPRGTSYVRPWLPGTLWAEVEYTDTKGQAIEMRFTRTRDWVSVPAFPATSFLVSEAHTFGAPFIHGVGINFKPLMNSSEERATDPLNGLKGPDLYRSLRWNEVTGWGDLVLLK